MGKFDKIMLFEKLKKSLSVYTDNDIENGIMCYYLNFLNKPIDLYLFDRSKEIYDILLSQNFPNDLETVIDFFEFLMETENKEENGIVFTPKYICNYIVDQIDKKNSWNKSKKIIDPGCGCGIFLISAAEMIYERYDTNIDDIIENYIYGIDIELTNVRRCILSLRLLSAKYGGNFNKVRCNIHCADSLKINWSEEFNGHKFFYIIGNPPYVNPHDMAPETAEFLKNSFKTTQKGVFNIFYAFIEHAMENILPNGVLGYIVPNNFLTIKSAYELRQFISSNKFLSRILDFGNNMVFKPVRTYNCILLLVKSENIQLDYCVMNKTQDIKEELKNLHFEVMNEDELDNDGWFFSDSNVRENINKIESKMVSIKPFIRTGIATLKDSVYMVDHDDSGFFKLSDEGKKYIETNLVKPIYKIPELKSCKNINDAERHIIFPYVKQDGAYDIIDEAYLKEQFPKTYGVLSDNREILEHRDKGKPNPKGWYAYGRSQGLNTYGKKLLFPTFSDHPKFIYIDNEDALFCNGYAVYENDYYDLDLLSKILNSAVMDYYVKNTSYSIEGGYFCYQKKYIEKFSIPWLTKEQTAKIKTLQGEDLDLYLWNLYGLKK